MTTRLGSPRVLLPLWNGSDTFRRVRGDDDASTSHPRSTLPISSDQESLFSRQFPTNRNRRAITILPTAEDFIDAIPHTNFPIKPFLPALQVDFTTIIQANVPDRRHNKYRYRLSRNLINVVIEEDKIDQSDWSREEHQAENVAASSPEEIIETSTGVQRDESIEKSPRTIATGQEKVGSALGMASYHERKTACAL